MSAGLRLTGCAVAHGGHSDADAAMAFSSVFVVSNSLRLRRFTADTAA